MQESLVKKRNSQFLFKLLAGLIPVPFLVLIALGGAYLLSDFLLISYYSKEWYLLLTLIGYALIAFYGVGYFAGSLRLDGNVTSLLSRMSYAEKKSVAAVLSEIIQKEVLKEEKGGKK